MLHLAFGERALLADEMGLGKTVQAIAACELLARRKGIARVLVVCPASLKAEWDVDAQLRVYGVKKLRIADGSIMPTITTGNTHAPCVIIGERLAEILNA
jgi:N12 class adenine-specific DNA methylase